MAPTAQAMRAVVQADAAHGGVGSRRDHPLPERNRPLGRVQEEGPSARPVEAPPSAVRGVVATLAVLLAGIVVGRLVLERSGVGLVALMFLLPVVFLACAAWLGIGRAALLVGLFTGVALLVRVIVLQSGWVALLLVPLVVASAYVLANTMRVLMVKEE